MSLDPHSPRRRKPRIMLLGEFSAGKSTLANALLGQITSPVRVTATQVPPIWYLAGDGAPVRVARDGTETPLEDTDLAHIPVVDTRVVRVPMEAEILHSVDLLDMPGSSDPNMDADIWDALLPEADAVIWCTPATQAWRQSEAAIWEDIPERLHRRSLLLLTRIDKVSDPRDKARVAQRVRRETDGLFRGVFAVSLLQALGAAQDPEAWQASGLDQVMDLLTEITLEITDPPPEDTGLAAATLRRTRATDGPTRAAHEPAPTPARAPAPAAAPPLISARPAASGPESGGPSQPTAATGILPRRVTPSGSSRRSRRSGGEALI